MSNIKELIGKTKNLIEWIFGAGVLIAAISYGILNYSTNYEEDRLKLAKDILRKTMRAGLEFEGTKVSEDMLDVAMTAFQNKNKAECKNSVIYYAFSADSDIIWIKTEKSGDMISAEVMTEELPKDCALYEKSENKWKKIEHINKTEQQSTTTQKDNNITYSSCDGMAVNLAVDTGCKYDNDTIKVEIQSENTSQTQSLYSQRFCVKGNVLTLLMGEAKPFKNDETAFHSLPQVHPQNINCPKLIEWLDNYGGMTMGIDDDEEPLYLGGRVG